MEDIPFGVAQCLRVGIAEEITKCTQSIQYGTCREQSIRNIEEAITWYEEYIVVGSRFLNERYEHMMKIYKKSQNK